MPEEDIKSAKIVEIRECGKSVFYKINDSVEKEIYELEGKHKKFAGMDMPLIFSDLIGETGYEKERTKTIIDECVGLIRKKGEMIEKYSGKAHISYNINNMKKHKIEGDIAYS